MDWLSLVLGLGALGILLMVFIAISAGNGSDCDGGCKQGRKDCDCREHWGI